MYRMKNFGIHVQGRVQLPEILNDGRHEDGGRRVGRGQIEASLVGNHRQH